MRVWATNSGALLKITNSPVAGTCRNREEIMRFVAALL